MDLHKAQVSRRVTPDCWDAVDGQPSLSHGLPHRHPLGVSLGQPVGVKVAGQCARAEEYCFIALAFFFGEGHHLNAEGQAPALLVQGTHTGHGRQYA